MSKLAATDSKQTIAAAITAAEAAADQTTVYDRSGFTFHGRAGKIHYRYRIDWKFTGLATFCFIRAERTGYLLGTGVACCAVVDYISGHYSRAEGRLRSLKEALLDIDSSLEPLAANAKVRERFWDIYTTNYELPPSKSKRVKAWRALGDKELERRVPFTKLPGFTFTPQPDTRAGDTIHVPLPPKFAEPNSGGNGDISPQQIAAAKHHLRIALETLGKQAFLNHASGVLNTIPGVKE